jgi:hypothetical protein
MGELYISSKRASTEVGLPDQGKDKLKTDDLNALEGPLIAVMIGGWTWPIHDIEPVIATARIDVCGKLQAIEFCDIVKLIDINCVEHDSEDFWHD